MAERALSRREFVEQLAALGVSVSVAGALAQSLRKRAGSRQLASSGSVPNANSRDQIRVSIILCGELPGAELIHILYDDAFFDTPMCFNDSEIGEILPKYKRSLDWTHLILEDPKLRQEIGTVPTGGKKIPRETFPSVADWVAKTGQKVWPSNQRISAEMILLDYFDGRVVIREMADGTEILRSFAFG